MLTINNTLDGYLKDVEIKGNTIQDASNLADIRSVGDKVEGQELYEIPVLSVGKNLAKLPTNTFELIDGELCFKTNRYVFPCNYKPNTQYTLKATGKYFNGYATRLKFEYTDGTSSTSIFFGTDLSTISITSQSGKSVKNAILDQNGDGIPVVGIYVANSIQLEEGTVATPYEPYVEDKLTILSPVQLEKVGDVRDRIIEKDGVWGVEKNIGNYIFDTSLLNLTFSTGSKNIQYYAENILPNALKDIYSVNNINSFCPSINRDNRETCTTVSCWNTTLIAFAMPKDMYPTITDFKNNIPKEIEFRYILAEPRFIPLPHDQQVKLRTFANKTNISFGCEIEGTIKAQVPKSLGATVNTHTEQINNLNKELDRVKKLEESTVSTVTTESDFTTVEATSNGYFEDVKLEGKTLVNLLNDFTSFTNRGYIYDTSSKVLKSPVGGNDSTIWSSILPMTSVECNKSYTLILNVLGTGSRIQVRTDDAYDDINISGLPQGLNIFAFIPKGENFKIKLFDGSTKEQKSFSHLMLLEGDHTQNPPSFFEGLKSVGQSTSEDGADEIVVSSVKGDGNLIKSRLVFNDNEQVEGFPSVYRQFKIPVIKGRTYYLKAKVQTNSNWKDSLCRLYHQSKSGVHTVFYDSTRNTNNSLVDVDVSFVANDDYVVFEYYNNPALDKNKNIYDNFDYLCLTSNPNLNPNTDLVSDKKRLLYYNEETQTWEKPILREWDSIEKHSNGKYYYHQRSGEVVLNGSEDISINGSFVETKRFLVKIENSIDRGVVVCDKFSWEHIDADYEHIYQNSSSLSINILTSKLSTQDVQGFKQWLQTNNVTVVYQLAQEKVYECTNIDLITYANETNYIVESGAIVPKTTLKVHNNISNVVSLLQKKVSLLESNITKYMITQNRMQLASTYSADSVTFKVDYFSLCGDEENYDEDLYNLILNNILVGKDNYDYDKMFTMILDYASWNQISWEQFDILVGLMDIQHNPPIEEIPTDDEIVEEIPNEIM